MINITRKRKDDHKLTCKADLKTRNKYGDAHRKFRGQALTICGKRAYYIVGADQKPMCNSHAGQYALAEALAAQERKGPTF